jgi:hypothetical protein
MYGCRGVSNVSCMSGLRKYDLENGLPSRHYRLLLWKINIELCMHIKMSNWVRSCRISSSSHLIRLGVSIDQERATHDLHLWATAGDHGNRFLAEPIWSMLGCDPGVEEGLTFFIYSAYLKVYFFEETRPSYIRMPPSGTMHNMH